MEVDVYYDSPASRPHGRVTQVKVARDAQNRTVVWSHSTDARSLFSRRFESSQGFRVKDEGEMSPKRNVRRAHVRTTFCAASRWSAGAASRRVLARRAVGRLRERRARAAAAFKGGRGVASIAAT